jgi:hypothetical protein
MPGYVSGYYIALLKFVLTICIFKNEKPRAYSPVNIFGHVTGDTSVLKNIKSGTEIRVSKHQI